MVAEFPANSLCIGLPTLTIRDSRIRFDQNRSNSDKNSPAMKSMLTVALAALVAVAQAVKFTNSAFDVQPGVPFTITWSEAVGPVTITLKNGAPAALQDVPNGVLTSK
jgi:hypothetical protein